MVFNAALKDLKSNKNDNIPNLFHEGASYENDHEKANLFCELLKKVFSNDDIFDEEFKSKLEKEESFNRNNNNNNLRYTEINLSEINETIKQTKGRKIEYFLDNSKFIFDYFENKKNISTGTTNINISDKNKILNSFFKIKQDDSANINQNKTNNHQS